MLRHRGFRRLFIAQTISRWGDTFNAVALVIVVFQITNSGINVSGVVALEIAPVLLLGFVAGTVVDRLPRRQVMIAADLGRAMIAALVAFNSDQLWALYCAAFGLAAGRVRSLAPPIDGSGRSEVRRDQPWRARRAR